MKNLLDASVEVYFYKRFPGYNLHYVIFNLKLHK